MVKIKCEIRECKKEAITSIQFKAHKGGSVYWSTCVCKEHRDKYLSKEWQDGYIGRAYEDKEFFEERKKYFERDKNYFEKKGLLL